MNCITVKNDTVVDSMYTGPYILILRFSLTQGKNMSSAAFEKTLTVLHRDINHSNSGLIQTVNANFPNRFAVNWDKFHIIMVQP